MPSTPQDLTRCTINLIRNAVDSLDNLHERLGLSKTDVINRAIQIYELVQDLADENGDSSIRVVRPDNSIERIRLL